MKTNDIKKDARILLTNGWYGTMMDNKKGNTRMAEIEGYYKEIGSVYAWDIAKVKVEGQWVAVELTPKQIKDQKMVSRFF